MTDHFSLLGLTRSFSIDLAALGAAYFSAQRQFHPDRMAGKAEDQRLAAAQRSADINQAYRTLKDPLLRARYLLSLNGVVVGTDHDTLKPSQALLMEIMDLHESPPDAKTLAAMKEESINRLQNHDSNQNWNAMAEETLRLGYLVKASHASAANS